MPLVKIDLKKGKSRDFLIKFMDIVHASLVDTLGITHDDRNQKLSEFDPDFFTAKPPYEYFIEITMFSGRTKETKARLFKSVVNKLHENLDINPNQVFIVINEQVLENWGIRGGIPASDVTFDFKI